MNKLIILLTMAITFSPQVIAKDFLSCVFTARYNPSESLSGLLKPYRLPEIELKLDTHPRFKGAKFETAIEDQDGKELFLVWASATQYSRNRFAIRGGFRALESKLVASSAATYVRRDTQHEYFNAYLGLGINNKIDATLASYSGETTFRHPAREVEVTAGTLNCHIRSFRSH